MSGPEKSSQPLPMPLLIVAGFTLLLIASTASSRAAELRPELRREISVYSDIVTLGDLFANAGKSAHIAVFRAPDLGTKGIVGIRRIKAAAMAHGLFWKNSNRLERVTVHRPSRKISLDAIEKLVRKALEERIQPDSSGKISITITAPIRGIDIDPGYKGEPKLSNLTYGRSSGLFRATLSTDNIAGPTYSISGRISLTREVAVLRYNIARRHVIGEADITMIDMPVSRLQRRYVQDASGLIGYAAKRNLKASQSILKRDLERPRLIRKNMLVTILFQMPGLLLRVQGKALEGGGMDETVSVKNTQSQKIVHATVSGPGIVTVSLINQTLPKPG